jgi:hypothetical protein
MLDSENLWRRMHSLLRNRQLGLQVSYNGKYKNEFTLFQHKQDRDMSESRLECAAWYAVDLMPFTYPERHWMAFQES